MKTRQETFDKVVLAIRAQGKPSREHEDGSCRYRGPGGIKCAAGHLIPDEIYDEHTMEYHIVTEGPVAKALADLGYDPGFVRKLQIAHDDAGFVAGRPVADEEFLNNFEAKITKLAADEGLVVP